MSTGKPSRRLNAEDWVIAAIVALGESGLTGVAVEPLAKRLGATKGSFYWHFKDRGALVDAVLARWEQLGTDEVIARLDELSDPVERLRLLFTEVIEYATEGREELALLAAIDQPVVADAMRRVAARRIEYVAAQLRLLAVPAAQASTRATVAVGIYHGINQLARVAPETLPATGELVDDIVGRLLESDQSSPRRSETQ
ncbi:TetR/AcrR family transcriptional regulator [Nocardia sp. XZ_19_231]|uniref:TetR/AcrR family transcriptional regulator n=1 Tax=Nocardia sp. XZ_19_231 TaxID=2769252 RepID=UPI00188E0083|nr:TetR/AcrR family transcriptional regulator [Nocardia sp. XZ_19_231]